MKTPDLADLDYAVEGPDRAYQSHGPGCRCKDPACPWWRGLETARIYREQWTTQQRLESWAEACAAMTGPSSGIFG